MILKLQGKKSIYARVFFKKNHNGIFFSKFFYLVLSDFIRQKNDESYF